MNAKFFLPWPDRRLSPNARHHWATKARAVKNARRIAFFSVVGSGIRKIEADALAVRYVFYPPDNRARDIDNMAASVKAYSDGIRDAIGIDDSKWTMTFSKAGAIERGGMVKVELEWDMP